MATAAANRMVWARARSGRSGPKRKVSNRGRTDRLGAVVVDETPATIPAAGRRHLVSFPPAPDLAATHVQSATRMHPPALRHPPQLVVTDPARHSRLLIHPAFRLAQPALTRRLAPAFGPADDPFSWSSRASVRSLPRHLATAFLGGLLGPVLMRTAFGGPRVHSDPVASLERKRATATPLRGILVAGPTRIEQAHRGRSSSRFSSQQIAASCDANSPTSSPL